MEMLLLGAGASIEAGVPAAFEMTEKMSENFNRRDQLKEIANVINFVIGGMIFDLSRKGINPFEAKINVEDLFNAIKLLAERKMLEAAPFIKEWHSFIEELDFTKPRAPSFDPISSGIRKYINGCKVCGKDILPPRKDLNIDSFVKEYVKTSNVKSGNGEIFRKANKYMTAILKDFVWITDRSKIKYLSPIMNILKSQECLTIATLNYDNSIELLSDTYSAEINTGISSWSERGIIDLGTSGIQLIKLHGSIDWTMSKNENSELADVVYSKLPNENVKDTEMVPAVIFGSKNKLTAEGPYLDLLRSFAERLKSTSLLNIIGYSFRDPHINVYISRWINGDKSRKVRIINGEGYSSRINGSSDEYLRELKNLSQANHERIEFMDKTTGTALKELYGEYLSPAIATEANTSSFAIEKLLSADDPNECT